MKEIKEGNIVLAKHITPGDIATGLNFYSDDNDFIQVGIWGNYEANKELKAHIHNIVERTITYTCEVLYVIKGKIEASIYNLGGQILDTLTVNQGDILILLGCGHGYKILENGTSVLEVKNGPYLGAEIDRRRI